MKHTTTETVPRNFTDNWTPKYFYIPAVALAVTLLTTNIISFKFVNLFGFKLGGGALLFPANLIIGDLATEVYGFRRTRKIIWLSLIGYLVYTLFTQLAVYLPPAQEWKNQELFSQVFGQTPRFFAAGATAYLTSELINSYIMSRMKIAHKGKYFSWRATVSAIVAELLNTSVYMCIAWTGIMEISFLAGVVITATTFKIIIQTLVLPITWALTKKLKALEGVDHFDAKI